MERVDILDRILRLEGVSYELDKTKDNLQGRQQRADVHGRQYGLIAQEVEKIFPELVCTDDYDFKGLHMQDLPLHCPVLLLAVLALASSLFFF